MIQRWILLTAGLVLLAGCGGTKNEREPEVQLDPYRAPMARRINEILYADASVQRIREELALLGVVRGMDFADFKEITEITDWFAEEWDYDKRRQISLTCGLSPVVSEDGRMVEFFRSRKRFDGKLYDELKITEE